MRSCPCSSPWWLQLQSHPCATCLPSWGSVGRAPAFPALHISRSRSASAASCQPQQSGFARDIPRLWVRWQLQLMELEVAGGWATSHSCLLRALLCAALHRTSRSLLTYIFALSVWIDSRTSISGTDSMSSSQFSSLCFPKPLKLH